MSREESPRKQPWARWIAGSVLLLLAVAYLTSWMFVRILPVSARGFGPLETLASRGAAEFQLFLRKA